MRFSRFLPKWSLWLVNSKIAHPHPHPPLPPSICHFVLEKLQMLHSGDRHPYKNPTVRLKNRMQMPHPRTTLKFVFSSRLGCKCHIFKIMSWKSLTQNTWSTRHKSLVISLIIIAKKDHLHLININDSDYKLDYFNNTFLIFDILILIVNDNKQPMSLTWVFSHHNGTVSSAY